jgi:hypothetical protein
MRGLPRTVTARRAAGLPAGACPQLSLPAGIYRAGSEQARSPHLAEPRVSPCGTRSF